VLREMGLTDAQIAALARARHCGGRAQEHEGAFTSTRSPRATASRSSRNSSPPTPRWRWWTRLSDCGYAKIEVTSFTSPKAIPMLRDAEEVMGRIRRAPGVEYTVLVPNVRGAERALESRADELNLVMSVSETHNLANLRMPREKELCRPGRGDPPGGRARADQRVAVVQLWLPDGGRCGAGRGAALGGALCRIWACAA
jgi:hypothetical protein